MDSYVLLGLNDTFTAASHCVPLFNLGNQRVHQSSSSHEPFQRFKLTAYFNIILFPSSKSITWLFVLLIIPFKSMKYPIFPFFQKTYFSKNIITILANSLSRMMGMGEQGQSPVSGPPPASGPTIPHPAAPCPAPLPAPTFCHSGSDTGPTSPPIPPLCVFLYKELSIPLTIGIQCTVLVISSRKMNAKKRCHKDD